MSPEASRTDHGEDGAGLGVPGSMPAQVRHDMINAVSIMTSAAHTLTEDDGAPLGQDTQRRLLEMIEARGRTLERLLRDLNELSRLDSDRLDLSIEPVPVRPLLDEVLAGMDTTDQRVHVTVADSVTVLADRFRLGQVIENLARNAQRHGGPNVWIDATTVGEHCVLLVSDDGPGITDELLPHLFTEYVRGPDSAVSGGSGLGLAIVRRLVDGMGGWVDHRSRRGGTQFRVALPDASEAEEAPVPAAPFDHVVTFYDHDDQLADELVDFVREGLEREEAVVVVATGPHIAALERMLHDEAGTLHGHRLEQRLTTVDAAWLLDQFWTENGLSPDAFDATVGALVADRARRFPAVRVYGEMVGLLWEGGDPDGAIALEWAWNDLHARHWFHLLCGYPRPAAPSAGDVTFLARVEHAHGRTT